MWWDMRKNRIPLAHTAIPDVIKNKWGFFILLHTLKPARNGPTMGNQKKPMVIPIMMKACDAILT